MPLAKDNIPNRDCPAWKPKKMPASGEKDG